MHCYSNSGKNASSKEDLSTEECLSVIDQLADAGLMVLAFSGGEPLIRDDWHRLASHAKSRGLVVNIGTNGSLIDERKADKMKNIGVNSVTVSMDSHRAALHDKFRRFEGLFEHAVRAIRMLVDRDIRVIVGFTPTKLNWKDGLGVVRLAHDVGASAVNLSQYVPAGRGPVSLTLDPDELRRYIEAAPAADIVVGLRSDRSDYTLLRHIISWTNIHILQTLFGIRLRQFQYISMYRTEVLRAIQIEYAGSAFFLAEILIKAHALGKRLVEVEIHYAPRLTGTPTGAKMLLVLLTVRDIIFFWLRWVRLGPVRASQPSKPPKVFQNS